MTSEPETQDSRRGVAATAIGLFAAQGFESTSVEQLATAAGMSRATFFRQIGGKEEAAFADHEALLASLADFLAEPHADPWVAVRDAALRAFDHLAADLDLARRRYEVVRATPVLRDREVVIGSRYERLFDEHLRGAVPGLDPADAVGFAALVTAVHNHHLRRRIRGESGSGRAAVGHALDEALRRFGVHPDGPGGAGDEVVVAVFPRAMPIAEVARRLADGRGGDAPVT